MRIGFWPPSSRIGEIVDVMLLISQNRLSEILDIVSAYWTYGVKHLG